MWKLMGNAAAGASERALYSAEGISPTCTILRVTIQLPL